MDTSGDASGGEAPRTPHPDEDRDATASASRQSERQRTPARRLTPPETPRTDGSDRSVLEAVPTDTTAPAWVPYEATKRYCRAYAAVTTRFEALDRDDMELAQARWQQLARRLERPVLLRRTFVEARTQLDVELLPPQRDMQRHLSPLREVLQRGHGGAVPLKMYLAALAGIGSDDRLDHPAPAKDKFLAEAFGLPDPGNQGRQRVRTARKALTDLGLLDPASNAVRGRPARLRPLHEAGAGWPYYVPRGRTGVDSIDANLPKATEVASGLLGDDADGERIDRAARMLAKEDLYLRVERELFTNGWITVLSGGAVAVLLILLQEATRFKHVRTRGGSDDPSDVRVTEYDPLWVGRKERHRRYGIDKEAWSNGIAELVAWGLIKLKIDKQIRDPADDDGDQYHPNRHRYQLLIRPMRRSANVGGPKPVVLASA